MKHALPTTIAIVGGGFSGVLTAIHIARLWRGSPLNVVLIESAARSGAGAAFGTRCCKHLMNVRSQNMSALADDPDHFVRWAQDRGLTIRPTSFAPRMWYADYISWLLEDVLRESWPGLSLTRVTGRVTDIIPHDDDAHLWLDDGRRFAAQRVVLATGNLPPANPVSIALSVQQSTRYVGNPWKPDVLRSIPAGEDVLLIGTGLTALDVALELHYQGHRGTIHGLSRRGQIPQAHSGETHVGLPRAPMELSLARGSTLALLRGVRAAIRRSAKEGDDWRTVLDALRQVTPQLWQSLGLGERMRFLRHLQPYWDTHRHRIPPEVASAVRLLRENGQFIIHRGRISECAMRDDHVMVRVQPRGMAHGVTLRVGRLINCTGPNCDVRDTPDSLLTNLKRRQLVVADPCGLGVLTTAEGAVIHGSGRQSRWLYVVGPLRKARLWECTAVPELRVHAFELAALLCGNHEQHGNRTVASILMSTESY